MDFCSPVYCDVYKHLLVEELYYISSPLKLHYGKCAVIGKLTFVNHRYLLENIQLPCFDKAHSLRTGAISVLIIPRHDMPLPLANQYVEVFGEAVLANRDAESVAGTPTTSAFLIQNLISMRTRQEDEHARRHPNNADDSTLKATIQLAVEQEVDAIRAKYQPAIYLRSFKLINEADEVILCNLELREMQSAKRLIFAHHN